MQPTQDLLDAVVAALRERRGDLRAVARDAGLSYDTVLRVRDQEHDTGYAKVRAIAEALGLVERRAEPERAKAAA